jgi:hypothetical protein
MCPPGQHRTGQIEKHSRPSYAPSHLKSSPARLIVLERYSREELVTYDELAAKVVLTPSALSSAILEEPPADVKLRDFRWGQTLSINSAPSAASLIC